MPAARGAEEWAQVLPVGCPVLDPAGVLLARTGRAQPGAAGTLAATVRAGGRPLATVCLGPFLAPDGPPNPGAADLPRLDDGARPPGSWSLAAGS